MRSHRPPQKEEATSGNSQTQPEPEPAEDPIDADPFFQDLKRKFDDLESRTGEMENHVASEEFELRREFKKMKE